MAKWTVECALTGKAWCEVEADTQDEAIEVAKEKEDWRLIEWDCNWSDYSGFIDASEVK